MSEPFWEALGGTVPGPAGPAGAQGPAGAAGSIPARLGGVCQTIGDWNAAIDNGWYMGSGALNAPVGGVWFYGIVTQHNSAWVTQRVTAFAGDYRSYVRHLRNGVWDAWTPVAEDFQQGMFQTGALSNDTQYGWNIWFPKAFAAPPRAVMLTIYNWNTNLDAFGYSATNFNAAYFDLYVRNIIQGGNFGVGWIAFA